MSPKSCGSKVTDAGPIRVVINRRKRDDSHMDCQEFEAQLEWRLDERLDPVSPELQAHTDECAPCLERLQGATALLHGVAAWRQTIPAPSVDLAARIAGQLHTASEQKPEIRVANIAASGSRWQAWIVAAGAIVAMWLVFLRPASDSGQPGSQIAKVIPAVPVAPPSPVPQKLPAADLETVLVSAEGAYSQLATETLEAAHDFALLWPTTQAVSTSPVPSAPQQQDSNWNQQWSRELAPIGDSVGDALDFLWRAAPRVEKSAT